MKVSERTISALMHVITGDPTQNKEQYGPYLSGPKLVAFFNEFGFNDVYAPGFPSRANYTSERLRMSNDTKQLASLIQAAVDPRRYFDTDFSVEDAVEYLNKYFAFDGWELRKTTLGYKLASLQNATVHLEPRFEAAGELSHGFIDEQIRKCDDKISSGDYDGAVTNARTLVEATLVAIEEKLTGSSEPYGGDLPKLYKRVQKLLNLGPERSDIGDTLRQILSGFVSVITGLSGLRNKVSDSHAITYRPGKHHAKLAVNAAKTLADFLFETLEYQQSRK